MLELPFTTLPQLIFQSACMAIVSANIHNFTSFLLSSQAMPHIGMEEGLMNVKDVAGFLKVDITVVYVSCSEAYINRYLQKHTLKS